MEAIKQVFAGAGDDLKSSKWSEPHVMDPIDMSKVDLNKATVFLPLKGNDECAGQRLYFHSVQNARVFAESPVKFLNFTRDPNLCAIAEKDMMGKCVIDPISQECIHVTKSTPRVQFKGGQVIFFKDYRNIWNALTDPKPYFQTLTIADVTRQTICPVTKTLQPLLLKGKRGKLAYVQLMHGQRIFCNDTDAVGRFIASPGDFKLTEVPKEKIAAIKAVREAFPKLGSKMNGQLVHCPVCNTSVKVSRSTPRVTLAGGQQVYFATYEHLDSFLTKPSRYFVTGESTTA